MAGIRLEWAQFGDFDSFDVIRSDAPMDINALPSPIASNLPTMYYVDTTVVEGATYYYRVVAWRDAASKVSGEIATQAGDLFWSDVELLIFADASVFPSTTIIDSSVKASPIIAVGGIQMINTQAKLYDDGWIYYDNTGSYATSNKYLTADLQSALNTSDFTFECFVKPDYAKSTQYARLFAIGTHSTNGMLSISKSGNPWVLNIDAYNGGWSVGTVVATPPSMPDGQIRHICLMRKAGIFYAFVDGVLSATKSDLTTFSLNQTNVFIGSHPFNNGTAFDSFGGYMSSIRLTRFARYSEVGFTPPNYKFPTGG